MALTAEEQIELIKFQNPQLLEAEILDKAKELLTSEFIKRSEVAKDETIAGQIIGSRMGKAETFLNQVASKHGIEWNDIVKSGKIEDKISYGFETLAKQLIEKDELIKGKGGDEFKAKLESEYKGKIDKLTTELQEKNSLLEDNKKRYEDLSLNIKAKEKDSLIAREMHQARSTFAISPDAKPLEIKGFESMIKDKYQFDTTEEGGVIVKLKETGKQIPSPKAMDAFMSIAEVLQTEAESSGIIAKSPAAGKKIGTFTPQPITPTAPTAAAKRVSPRAMGGATV
jgi:hypothetical protein